MESQSCGSAIKSKRTDWNGTIGSAATLRRSSAKRLWIGWFTVVIDSNTCHRNRNRRHNRNRIKVRYGRSFCLFLGETRGLTCCDKRRMLRSLGLLCCLLMNAGFYSMSSFKVMLTRGCDFCGGVHRRSSWGQRQRRRQKRDRCRSWGQRKRRWRR